MDGLTQERAQSMLNCLNMFKNRTVVLPPNLHPLVRPCVSLGMSAPRTGLQACCGLQGCLYHWLGGHVWQACSVRGLDGPPTALAHQLPSVVSSKPCLEPSPSETGTFSQCYLILLSGKWYDNSDWPSSSPARLLSENMSMRCTCYLVILTLRSEAAECNHCMPMCIGSCSLHSKWIGLSKRDPNSSVFTDMISRFPPSGNKGYIHNRAVSHSVASVQTMRNYLLLTGIF